MTAGMKRSEPGEGFNPYENYDSPRLFYSVDHYFLGSWDDALFEKLSNSLLPADNNWAHNFRLGKEKDAYWPESDNDFNYACLRVACEGYAKNRNSNEKENLLEKVKTLLLQMKDKWFPLSGVALPYVATNKFSLVRLVYLLEDDSLTTLFKDNLPVPTSHYFSGLKVPASISSQEAKTNDDVRSFLRNTRESDFKTVEKSVLFIQRIIRSNQRKNEEEHRLQERYGDDAKIQMEKRYVPKCQPLLSERIMRLSSQVVFLESIRHICHSNALPSIFDQALYGRKSLLRNYIPFSEAALGWGDVLNGDSDVVCFGAKHGLIDPLADGDIELVLDLKKLNLPQPFAPYYSFFKQRDLFLNFKRFENEEMKSMAIRSLQITSEKTFLFKACSCSAGWFSCKYEDGEDLPKNCSSSEISPYKLMSYDVANINSSLILYFFKYLDHVENKRIVNEFYSDISEMSDERLMKLLKEIGENISITMELNFYGAHQIDFDSLKSVVKKSKNFSLDIPSLVQEIQSGKLDLYKKAKKVIPTLFQSYRFLDYLISKEFIPGFLDELSQQRGLFKAPIEG